MDTQEPPPAVEQRWGELLEDAETTAAEYDADGYETRLVHPGDVTPVTGEPYGLDVLAPGDEFEALEALVERATFDTSHVYYADEGVMYTHVRPLSDDSRVTFTHDDPSLFF